MSVSMVMVDINTKRITVERKVRNRCQLPL